MSGSSNWTCQFLIEERTDRVENNKDLLERADVTAAEKFRVVMEAWQIENDYARTISTYTDELEIGGVIREVDVLQVGRVALLYQTPDGAESGAWDQRTRQWGAGWQRVPQLNTPGNQFGAQPIGAHTVAPAHGSAGGRLMKVHRLSITAAALAALVWVPLQAQDAEVRSLDELLDLVEEGRARDNAAEEARIREFEQSQMDQQRLLDDAQADKAAEEARSAQLETTFEENELLIADVTEQLNARLGSLRELFGVLQQVAGDARGLFEASLTNVEYPERSQFLTDLAAKMGSSSQLASISEIEQLWFELQREATELGKIKRIPDFEVIAANGDILNEDIVRIGGFNIVADGRYLARNPETNSVGELQRQPEQGRFTRSTAAMLDAGAGDDFVRFGLDPTSGQILGLLVREPSFRERLQQGGIVGYIIITLGIFGVLLSIERIISLGIAGRKVKAPAEERRGERQERAGTRAASL